VSKRFHVLIADKNPHIRNFLKREFTTAGYIVRVAESSEQLLKMVYEPMRLDLLIIDPDLPDADFTLLSRKLRDRVPQLPVVVHTLDASSENLRLPFRIAQRVEKNGCSVESLKKTVAGMLSARQRRTGGGQSR